MIIFKNLNDEQVKEIQERIGLLQNVNGKSTTEHARLVMLKTCLIKNEYFISTLEPEILPF